MKIKPLPMLVASIAFCIFLFILRVIESGTANFYYMIWNLFLAWIPIVFSTYVVTFSGKKHRKAVMVCFFLWLLFFPNAPYLVTDIIHLQPQDITPLWFDLLFLQSYAIVGFFITYLSLHQVQTVIKRNFGTENSRYISIAILYLTSVGVAAGRFFRWNSWDLFLAPSRIFMTFVSSFHNPLIMIQAFAFSTFFFFFLAAIYLLLFQSQGLNEER